MGKRKKLKSKSKLKSLPQSKTPTRAIVVLSLGIAIAVVGSMTIPTMLEEREDGLSVIISVTSLLVGVPLALWGLRMMRPDNRKKKKKSQ